jgi:hypothetical protein
MPVVVVDPQGKLVANVRGLVVGGWPELFQDRSLYSLDLSVQMWRPRRNRPESYGLVHQAMLDRLGEELGASVRLDPLDRERHLLQHLIVAGLARRRSAGATLTFLEEPATIVDRRKLVEARSDIASVHLHPITGHRTIVTLRLVTPSLARWQDIQAMSRENFVDRCRRKSYLVQAPQLVPKPLCPQPPLPAQSEDQGFLCLANLQCRRMVWAATPSA